MSNVKTNCLVIGIGNEFRSDDGIGIVLSRKLKEKLPAFAEVVECQSAGVELMEIWQDYNTVFVIDAAHSGSAPGTIFCFDANKEPLPLNAFNYSSHSFSLAETVELARKLNRLPHRLRIFGIEVKKFEHGTDLTVKPGEICDSLFKKIMEDAS